LKEIDNGEGRKQKPSIALYSERGENHRDELHS